MDVHTSLEVVCEENSLCAVYLPEKTLVRSPTVGGTLEGLYHTLIPWRYRLVLGQTSCRRLERRDRLLLHEWRIAPSCVVASLGTEAVTSRSFPKSFLEKQVPRV